MLLACAAREAASWPLTAGQLEALDRGEVLVEADVDRRKGRGDVRAAVRVTAPAAHVFAVMTDCAQALEFVPRMRKCVVRETAPDRSWQLIEHEIDYGWYLPATRYTFRAEYEQDRSVAFRHVSGDFRENEGLWELAPAGSGGATIVTYTVRIVPRFYVPQWLLRASLRRDLPELMRALRAYCERPEAQRNDSAP
jgi:ribosome-associated toxin RatA of RatAB toxin-antitoxin module